MGASDLIGRLALAGVRLSILAPDKLAAEPRAALTDDLRRLIREHKAELIAALEPIERGRELRRQRVLAKLAAEPERQRVAIFDPDAERDYVLCTLAIRDVGTCELRIPRERFDPWAVLDALCDSGQKGRSEQCDRRADPAEGAERSGCKRTKNKHERAFRNLLRRR